MRRRLIPLLVVIAIAASACGDAATPPTTTLPAEEIARTAAFPVIVRGTVLEERPERIVSLSATHTEILYAIGAGERVVATDRFSDYPETNLAKATLEYSAPDPEAALALEPDLVLLSTQQADQLAQFRSLGLPVYYTELPADLEGVYANIALFGRLTGQDDAATELVAAMGGRIEAVSAALAEVAHGPRVFYELSADLYTVAPGTFVGALLGVLKADNVAAGATSPYPQLSAEAVIAADPEVVLLADAEYGESLESVRARPGWSGVSAVVSGRVQAIDPDLVNRPGPRLADGIEALARVLYPERFE